MKTLDQRLLDAHEKGDKQALVALYTEASDQAAEEEAEAFFLTHALVFALELGAPQAKGLRARLAELKRIEP